MVYTLSQSLIYVFILLGGIIIGYILGILSCKKLKVNETESKIEDPLPDVESPQETEGLIKEEKDGLPVVN